MKISALLQYLLANRATLSGDTIADCLDLAVMVADAPSQRIHWQTLAARWKCKTRQHVRQRLARMKDAGLLEYDPGVRRQAGYLIHRVGPAL